MDDRSDTTCGELSPTELDDQIASDLPDREAMSLVPPDLLAPVNVLPTDSLITQVLATEGMPAEAQTLDFNEIVAATLSPDGSPLDALPPELVPESQQITEHNTIGG
ncbi:MAG TPA: hypothetical protein VHL09_13050 [Dehalococcoidia bacterium]|nr:hypothetical protein [Dehalococcoidia bacterium]